MMQELVVEKESRIHETMLMMGLKHWVLWNTWYLKQFLFLMLPVIVICILLKVAQFYIWFNTNCIAGKFGANISCYMV